MSKICNDEASKSNTTSLLKIIVVLIGMLMVSHAYAQQVIPANPTKIVLADFDNLYQISDRVYRSEQPTSIGMQALEKLGIGTIVNLRSRKNDQSEAKNTALDLVHIRINTWVISEEELLKALKAIQQSKTPVLIHCLHGSDRTGAVIAAYRMVVESCPKEEAIEEFLDPQFGYHAGWFPNILRLLESIDIERFQKELGINPK